MPKWPNPFGHRTVDWLAFWHSPLYCGKVTWSLVLITLSGYCRGIHLANDLAQIISKSFPAFDESYSVWISKFEKGQHIFWTNFFPLKVTADKSRLFLALENALESKQKQTSLCSEAKKNRRYCFQLSCWMGKCCIYELLLSQSRLTKWDSIQRQMWYYLIL